MSSGSSVPYRLRPNKAVDRELFLSLLARSNAALKLHACKYVGLGGPFMEDFRLIHARIGIHDMDSVEMEEEVHRRQSFNKPIESITCHHSSLEDYLSRTKLTSPTILWLDYNEPRPLPNQISTFAAQAATLPVGSIVRLTLNANPESLGVSATAMNLRELRLQAFKQRVRENFAADLTPDDFTRQRYGVCVLRAAKLAVEKAMLGAPDRIACWALSTVYADGQPMATTTVVLLRRGDLATQTLIRDWEYYSLPEEPLVIDMPALSTLERLTMEACDDPKSRMNFTLPSSFMEQDPIVSFKRFYRVFPHFTRVEL